MNAKDILDLMKQQKKEKEKIIKPIPQQVYDDQSLEDEPEEKED